MLFSGGRWLRGVLSLLLIFSFALTADAEAGEKKRKKKPKVKEQWIALLDDGDTVDATSNLTGRLNGVDVTVDEGVINFAVIKGKLSSKQRGELLKLQCGDKKNKKKRRRCIKKLVRDGRVQALDYTPPSEVQWDITALKPQRAWNVTRGAGIKVGVIDTGIARNHPELVGVLKGGVNLVGNGSADFNDDNGHGTHVAGTIAAKHNNSGIAGLAPEIELYGIKVLDSNGSGFDSAVLAGINWANANGMNVINLSLGGSRNTAIQDAIRNGNTRGMVTVAAAGNRANQPVAFPAAFPEAIAVAAVDRFEVQASFSSIGPELDISAPGVGIASTYPPSGYNSLSGTSMAAPHVAAAAALILAYPPVCQNLLDTVPGCSSAEVMKLIKDSARQPAGYDPDRYGAGLLDLDRAFAGVTAPQPPQNVAPTISQQPRSLTVTAGQRADFAVLASGTAPLSYQWRKNGTPISGATSSGFSIPAAQPGDAGGYSVVVSNVAGSVPSSTATLTVNPANPDPGPGPGPGPTPGPINLPSVCAEIPTGHFRGCYFDNMDFTAAKGWADDEAPFDFRFGTASPEPTLLGPDQYSIHWHGKFELSGSCKFEVLNDDGIRFYVDGTLLIDQFREHAAPAEYEATRNMSPGMHTIKVEFFKNVGNGAVRVRWSCGAPPVDPDPPQPPALPVITENPKSVTKKVGERAVFEVGATGGNLTYQWQQNGANIPGATTFRYETPPVNRDYDGLLFRVIVSNAAGSAVSQSAKLTVTSETGGSLPLPAPSLMGFKYRRTYFNVNSLTWSAVPGAASYKVYRSTAPNSLGTVRTTTTATFFNDSTPTRTYYYRVVAVGENGVEGVPSNQVWLTK